MNQFVGTYLVVDAANTTATSALPNAPVVDDGRADKAYVPGVAPQGKVRVSTAGVLRRMADRVEGRALAGATR